ncbi:G5 domain-containing protein [Candidatus Parcubacteria bacterium]|nr:G5 domain-containing protein [Candidatus Parcubacteria bacterium]
MSGGKKAGKISLLVVLGVFLWPVMLGVWLSHHAHRKIEVPLLRYLAIAAIMLPALTAGTAWASVVVPPSPGTDPIHVTGGAVPGSADQVEVGPKLEKKMETVTERMAFRQIKTHDATLAQGQEVVRRQGRAGAKSVTYEVSYSDGQETGRVKVKEEITTAPIARIVAVGTKVTVAPPAPVAAPQPVPAPSPSPRPVRPMPIDYGTN